ncbi:Bax inhibitor-1/YccA family protein [Corynebacterium sp. ZY180755]
MRSSSNPVLSSLSDTRNNPYATPQVQDPYSGHYAQQAPVTNERPMTVDDVVSKTGITLAVIIGFAIANFAIAYFVNPGMAMMLTMVGAIGGFITVLVSSFSKRGGSSALVTLIYAAMEGLFVGGISMVFSGFMVGNADAGALVGQAVLGTVGVFIGMLFVYKTGAVKVTPKFNRILTACLVGVLVLVLGNLVMSLFGIASPLRDGGPIAIIFSLVCIGLAAMSFLVDFDVADKMIRQGAPARMAWGVALGLAVTLVWLYTEILRLLSYFQQR